MSPSIQKHMRSQRGRVLAFYSDGMKCVMHIDKLSCSCICLIGSMPTMCLDHIAMEVAGNQILLYPCLSQPEHDKEGSFFDTILGVCPSASSFVNTEISLIVLFPNWFLWVAASHPAPFPFGVPMRAFPSSLFKEKVNLLSQFRTPWPFFRAIYLTTEMVSSLEITAWKIYCRSWILSSFLRASSSYCKNATSAQDARPGASPCLSPFFNASAGLRRLSAMMTPLAVLYILE